MAWHANTQMKQVWIQVNASIEGKSVTHLMNLTYLSKIYSNQPIGLVSHMSIEDQVKHSQSSYFVMS